MATGSNPVERTRTKFRDYSDEEKKELEEKIVSIVAKEFGKSDLPIIANFDVEHPAPQLICCLR